MFESVPASARFLLVSILWPMANSVIGVSSISVSMVLLLIETAQSTMSFDTLQNTAWISLLLKLWKSVSRSVVPSFWSVILSVSVRAVQTVLAFLSLIVSFLALSDSDLTNTVLSRE